MNYESQEHYEHEMGNEAMYHAEMMNAQAEAEAMEQEQQEVKLLIYKIECLNQDGQIEINGHYRHKADAEMMAKKMDNYPENKRYNIIQMIIEIEVY